MDLKYKILQNDQERILRNLLDKPFRSIKLDHILKSENEILLIRKFPRNESKFMHQKEKLKQMVQSIINSYNFREMVLNTFKSQKQTALEIL
ncbi:8299_t:CDS:2, partial [Gigaspora margarita]